jgi:hypothetical protein
MLTVTEAIDRIAGAVLRSHRLGRVGEEWAKYLLLACCYQGLVSASASAGLFGNVSLLTRAAAIRAAQELSNVSGQHRKSVPTGACHTGACQVRQFLGF